jgi:hypothetical protein
MSRPQFQVRQLNPSLVKHFSSKILNNNSSVSRLRLRFDAELTRFRVQLKLCLLMHNIHTGCAPAYLINSVQATSSRIDTRRPAICCDDELRHSQITYHQVRRAFFLVRWSGCLECTSSRPTLSNCAFVFQQTIENIPFQICFQII